MAAAPTGTQPAGFVTVSRTVVSAAADLMTNVQRVVVGPAKVRTAWDNAFAATLADKTAREARLRLTREVAALVAAGHTAPRNRAGAQQKATAG
ncbi:hypothetical protein [Actinoplanes sp. TBRC 11911]|uniref:hypothetical protein n=1 Tax=Actinoplanes sp. TBRC 11911 TaxID=2729386 RepID=UPI00200711D9|nr:hypothetical protein [Actinoplanes sp. TBRC 11911]